MGYQNETKPAEGNKEKPQSSKKDLLGGPAPDLPNSLMGEKIYMIPPGLPNSIMREMLGPKDNAAEETDLLSGGIRGGMPNTVRREMEEHPDPGVSFGRAGIKSPAISHELVHNGRRQPVSGSVSLSVPSGTVQREGFGEFARKIVLLNRVKKKWLAKRQANSAAPIPQSDQGTEGLSPAPSGAVSPAAEDITLPNPGKKSGTLNPSPPPTGTGGSSSGGSSESPAPAPPKPATVTTDDPPESPAPAPLKPNIVTSGDPSVADPGSSTMSKPVRTEAFNGLSVLVNERLINAKAAETMIRNEQEEAARSRTVSSSDVSILPDPNIQPEPGNGGELIRDSVTGLWVEKAGRDLFVYIRGTWYAAVEDGPVPNVDEDDETDASVSVGEPDDDITDSDTVGGSSTSNGLPDPGRVFGNHWRFRMSRTALTDEQINGMVAYYKAYALQHRSRVFPTSPKIIAGPIQRGLSEANDAVESVMGDTHQGNDTDAPIPSASPSPPLSSSPEPDADEGPAPVQVPGVLPGRSNYHGQGSGWLTSKKHTGNAAAALNIGMGVNAFGRQGVLLNNYVYHVSRDAKDNLPVWDKSKWKLPTTGNPVKDSSGNVVSTGSYEPYVNYVAPIAGAALGTYGAFTGLSGMVHGIHDTVRQRQNVEAGASRWDAAQSGLDTVAATSSTMSSIWGTVQNAGNIGGAAVSTFGDAANAIPGLSIVTGTANAISGTSQAIRGRATRSELNAAGKELDRIAAQQQADGNPAPAAAPGQLTDQEKLQTIMNQGHKTAVYNMWSGGLKAAAGGVTAAAGISTLAGAAPVAAGLQGLAAVLNLAKFIFERAYKSHMRNSIVGEEFDINWKEEMKDVRAMIKEHNKHLGVRDKDVREVILKAHGSMDTTRTAAYKTIKLNRARYLINTATDPGNAFHKVAEMVIEAMGVHKVGGNNFAAGAAELLAEKLG